MQITVVLLGHVRRQVGHRSDNVAKLFGGRQQPSKY
jgi:hypothetical protein